MNKKVRIGLDITLIIVGIVFLVFGIKDAVTMYKSSKVDDNVKFYRSYSSVEKDNIYDYLSIKETDKFLKDGTGVIIFGETTDPWMQVLVKPLEDIVRDNLNKIYYFELDDVNIDDEAKNIKQKIGNITSPRILIVKNGKILTDLQKGDLIDEEYEDAPIDYYDEERIETLKSQLIKISELS